MRNKPRPTMDTVGSEGRIRRFFEKDFTQYLVFAVPMAFIALFLLYPMATTLIRAFMAPAEDLAFHG